MNLFISTLMRGFLRVCSATSAKQLALFACIPLLHFWLISVVFGSKKYTLK